MTDPFEDPASPSGVDWDALSGSLLLVSPYTLEQNVNTTFGVKDAVRADVAVLDGAHKGEVYVDALVFPRVMIGQLRPMLGKKVIGRLGLGVAKAGQKAPWKLNDATPDDKRLGVSFLSGQLASAAPASEPPF